MIPLKDNIPTERTPWVTIALIAINVFVYFVLEKGGILSGPGNAVVIDWGAIPYEITHPGQQCDVIQAAIGPAIGCGHIPGSHPPTILTIFSSMFMHGSILHLAGNMLFLWIFGNNVEDSMGPVRFIVFYLLGGLAADAGQILFSVNSTVPSIGASGAVAGVLGGYLLLFPRARVVTLVFIIFFFTILELPAILFLGIWIIQQALFAYFDLLQPAGSEGGVAYFAHIGGFVFGLLLIRVFASERRRRRQLDRAGMT